MATGWTEICKIVVIQMETHEAMWDSIQQSTYTCDEMAQRFRISVCLYRPLHWVGSTPFVSSWANRDRPGQAELFGQLGHRVGSQKSQFYLWLSMMNMYSDINNHSWHTVKLIWNAFKLGWHTINLSST